MTAQQRNTAVPAVYLFLRRDDMILLMRRQGSGYYDGWYSVMGGHVEAGELPLDALVRETKEELGISIEKASARLIHTMYRTKHDPTGDRADYFFSVSAWSGEPSIQEAHKCDDVRWFSLAELPHNLMDHVRIAIDRAQQGVVYSELDSDHVFQSPEARLISS